jgi:hypothetical protein
LAAQVALAVGLDPRCPNVFLIHSLSREKT